MCLCMGGSIYKQIMGRLLESIEVPKPRWWMVLFFFNIGMLFHVIMMVPICVCNWFPRYLIVLILMCTVLFLYMFTHGSFFPFGRKKWLYLSNELLLMQVYRERCRYLYQMQVFLKFRWYALQWVGPLWMVASLFIFFYVMVPQEKFFWILSSGTCGLVCFL